MSEFDFEPLSRPASTLRYVVCGASGRVGRSVAERLLSQGHSVRAVTRDAGRVSDLAERGADIRVGSPQDAEFLAGVMDGADAAFVLTPVDVLQPDVNAEQARVVRGTLEAIRRSGLRHVVLLSSWGAELAEPVGGVIATHWFEQGLDAIDRLNAVYLRPVWFMENFLFNIGLIKAAGINGQAIDPDVPFPTVATADIAAIASEYLEPLSFTGRTVRYVSGPRDYTMTEVTRILGTSIGRPDLQYTRLPDAVMHKALVDSGHLTPNAAQLLIEINQAISTGHLHAEPRTHHNSTPTTLEHFAKTTFAPAYHAAPTKHY